MANLLQAQAPDLYKTAQNAPPLPSQFQVTPQPIIGSNDLKNIQDQHSQVYQQAMAYGRMNPDVVLKALAPGGSLSNSFGFSNAADVTGLTPEQVMALTQGRGVNESLQGAQRTLDTVTGAPEIRQMLTHQADQTFGVNANMLAQQNAQALSAQAANAGHSMQLATDQAKLNQDWQTHLDNLKNQKDVAQMHIASTEKIANQVNARAIDSLRAQLQMHKENLKMTLSEKQAEQQAALTENAMKQIEGVVMNKEHTEAGASLANQVLVRHPELNAGFAYQIDSFLGGFKKLVPVPLTAGFVVDKNGKQVPVWNKPNGEPFSLRK